MDHATTNFRSLYNSIRALRGFVDFLVFERIMGMWIHLTAILWNEIIDGARAVSLEMTYKDTRHSKKLALLSVKISPIKGGI